MEWEDGEPLHPQAGVTWRTRAVTSVSCQVEGGWPPPERWCEQLFSSVVPVLLGGSEEEPGGRQLLDLDCFLSDISDTLFTMTQPSPSSLQLPPEDTSNLTIVPSAYVGNADMIQPDLTPLQPSLDDFMEISEPLCDSFQNANSAKKRSRHPRMTARNSCPGPLDSSTFLNSDFLLPEDPKTKIPPAPAPTSLLPYPTPVKTQGLEPCTPSPFPTMAPLPTLLPEEPLFSTRFPFTTVPPAPGVPTLPAPTTFVPTPQPGPGPGPSPSPFPVDHLPHGYPEPVFRPHFAMPQDMQPRCKPSIPSPGGRKGSLPTLAPTTASPTATARDNNPCLTQLLRAAKPEQALEPPTAPSTLLRPAESPDTVSELPRVGAFFSPIPAPTPPQPPPCPATLAPPRSLIVPKAERLSPPAPSGSERRLSGDLNSIPPTGALSVHLSPPQPILSRGRVDNNKMENRRITHISAEQKRRFNIKLGFDTLHGLVSTLSAQPSLKVSPQPEMHTPLESWSPSLDQHPTPDPGACRHRGPHWWRSQFSILIRPLFESFNGMVSTASLHSLRQTSLAWLDQYSVLNSLRQLSTSTSILTDPSRVPEQATRAVTEGTLGRPF
ncbi:hypothetical protein A6R68_11082 [Neotoma lepida]|uniref:BHLH domain-containing protein n=1 Tax=Neotoma lepida TaxID=56216 RepID=A0A1A6FW28_NEOLE|nr:hypothetical protein A6R68_11082 [Neotoma lepida]